MSDSLQKWLGGHERLAAAAILTAAFLVRLWAAHGTFLNPDEALHFQIANHSSWAEAYRASLTTAHPPLLIFVLHFWRALGTLEWMLRLPSVIAGTVFCWLLFGWMKLGFGRVEAWIALIFAGFLPPIVALSAEVRQYALLLCFMGAALYLTELAFEKQSATRLALAYVFVCLALLTHYSALWFAMALGLYSFLRLGKVPVRWKITWVVSQGILLLLFAFLYRTHLAGLNSGAAITQQEWLSNSLFHRGTQSLPLFVFARSVGVFQFIFGQLAVGDVAAVLFAASLVLLGKRKDWTRVALLAVPFVLNCAAAVAGVYPYGGTRHSAFLIPFAIAGISVTVVSLTKQNLGRALWTVAGIILVSALFGSPHRPYMTRADQTSANMSRAMTYLRQNLPPDSTIVVDYQSSLLVGHYLCRQRAVAFDRSNPGFVSFRCDGFRVLSSGPETSIFTAGSFLSAWERMGAAIPPGDPFWVVQTGWDIGLGDQLPQQFHDARIERFGRNLEVIALRAPSLH